MTRRTTTQEKVRPQRRLRRWIIASVLGLLLGLALILFLTKVYNPFGDQIESPLVLIPDTADFVLSIPDFPDFLGQLRDRPFVEALGDHEGFQAFLKTKAARDTGILSTLRDAFARLDEIGTSLPLGLELLGDVSGTHVLVAGYLPDRTDERAARGDVIGPTRKSDEVRFMLVFQPESWKALAGVNILLDETLCGWFMQDQIESQGITIEHRRDAVMLELPRGRGKPGERPPRARRLFITRIADTVLVSTEDRELDRIYNFVAKKGVPESTATRYARLENAYGGFQVQLLCRRKKMDRFMKLEEQLIDQWGEETLEFAESTLPRLGGEDMIVELDVNRGLGMALGGPLGAEVPGDLAPVLQRFSASDLRADFDELTQFLPDDVFAAVRLSAPLGKVFEVLFERDNLLTDEDRKDLKAELAKVEVFQSWTRLTSLLTQYTEPRIHVVFFRQPREPLEDQAEAGFALVCPLTDPAGLASLLDGLDGHVRSTRGEGIIKQIYQEKDGDARLFKIEVASGVVDDPRVTIPGIAIAHGHLIFTNYFPFLRKIPDAIRNDGKVQRMGGQGFDVALAYAPREMLLASVIDGDAMQRYFDQSATGWAYEKTTPKLELLAKWRAEAKRIARRRGLDPLSGPGGTWVDGEVKRRIKHLTDVERPEAVRKHRETIEQFRGLIQGAGIFVEAMTGGSRMSVRIEPHKSSK